jgi:hypothetical protein
LCPLCDVADETIDHIPLHCNYAQGIWRGLVQHLALPDIVPVGNLGIGDWWVQVASRFGAGRRREANSLIMLAMRALWLERNARVFENKRMPMTSTLSLLLDEWTSWLVTRGRTAREIE